MQSLNDTVIKLEIKYIHTCIPLIYPASHRITSAHDSLKTISTTNATQSQFQAPIQNLFKPNLSKKRSQAKPSQACLRAHVHVAMPCHAMLCHLWMICFHDCDCDCDCYKHVVSCHVMPCHASILFIFLRHIKINSTVS